jgi:hypothetical protein
MSEEKAMTKKTAFPASRAEMELAGYSRNCYAVCRGCGKAIEFWNSPKGSRLPMERMPLPESPATSHFATCPRANDFRKGKA